MENGLTKEKKTKREKRNIFANPYLCIAIIYFIIGVFFIILWLKPKPVKKTSRESVENIYFPKAYSLNAEDDYFSTGYSVDTNENEKTIKKKV